MQSHINFDLKSACDYKFQTLPHPTIFSTACIRSKESLSIPSATQGNLEPILLLRSFDEHQKQKDKILDSPKCPPPLNKTRNLPPWHLTTLPPVPPCHLTILPPFPTCHLTTLSPFRPCYLTILPPFPPCHLTTLPPFRPSQPTTLALFPAHLLPNHKYITPK